MRAVIQRVSRASVYSEKGQLSSIGKGFLVLVGIEEADKSEDIEWLASKIVQLRVFDDSNGVMNLSVQDSGGDIIIVSQFTLHAMIRKGNRPSYIRAAAPVAAIPLYEGFVGKVTELMGKKVGTGEFGAMMSVELVNDGPVTIIIDTKNRDF